MLTRCQIRRAGKKNARPLRIFFFRAETAYLQDENRHLSNKPFQKPTGMHVKDRIDADSCAQMVAIYHAAVAADTL